LLGQVFKGKKAGNQIVQDGVDALIDDDPLWKDDEMPRRIHFFVTAASAPAPPQQLGEQNPHIF
jgi:hypothetical protein